MARGEGRGKRYLWHIVEGERKGLGAGGKGGGEGTMGDTGQPHQRAAELVVYDGSYSRARRSRPVSSRHGTRVGSSDRGVDPGDRDVLRSTLAPQVGPKQLTHPGGTAGSCQVLACRCLRGNGMRASTRFMNCGYCLGCGSGVFDDLGCSKVIIVAMVKVVLWLQTWLPLL